MLAPPDAPLPQSLLTDAFDHSRYTTFKAKDIQLPTFPSALRRPTRQQAFFASFKEISPRKESRRHPRNVSEPQLISSTNYMRESWYMNFGSARTVGDIANLSTRDDILPTMKHSRSTVSGETLLHLAERVEGDDDEASPLLPLGSHDMSERVDSSDREELEGDEDSLYSTDSADQEAHPFLLSMPVIPQIKLERKATVRKPEPGLALDDTQRSLLSPRIRNLRTPARVTSRRYGRIVSGTNSRVVVDLPMTQTYIPATACSSSAFEPNLNPAEISDDEEHPLLQKDTVESTHADVLLSLIDEVGSSLSSAGTESSLDETSPLMRVPPKHSQRSHRRSTATSHSLSFSNLVLAVADGCAALDTILRKPKSKPQANQTTTSQAPLLNSRNPRTPKNGQILIKVFVPSTDEIWMFSVPETITLVNFTSRVVSKLGFAVSFSGSVWDEPKYHFRTDERFREWVKRRVRFGRNLPIVAHVVEPLPLIKLSVQGDGCEIWCYA